MTDFKVLPPTIYERFNLSKFVPKWFGHEFVSKLKFDTWVEQTVAKLPRNDDPDKMRLSLQKHFYYIHKFKLEGSNRFMVTDKLAEMLAATDYTGIYADMIKLPFEVFTIDISNIGLKVNIDRANRNIREVMVYNNEDSDNLISMIFYLDDNDDNMFVVNIDMTPGTNIVKNIEYAGGSNSEKDKESTIKAVTMTMGIILYINSKSYDGVVVRPKKLFAKDSAYPSCKLGSKIINKFKYEDNETGSAHEINVLKYPVRGHFRDQPCGKGRSLVEIVWIEPYFKGKERNSDIASKPSNTIL